MSLDLNRGSVAEARRLRLRAVMLGALMAATFGKADVGSPPRPVEPFLQEGFSPPVSKVAAVQALVMI